MEAAYCGVVNCFFPPRRSLQTPRAGHHCLEHVLIYLHKGKQIERTRLIAYRVSQLVYVLHTHLPIAVSYC